MSVTDVLAMLTLVVGVPLNVAVTVLLWRKSREAPYLKVLRERFVAEAFVLLVVIVFGLIFVNNDMNVPLLETNDTKLITRLTILGIAVIPACYWLWLYRGRRP